jgi:hypothetical protein
MAAVLTPFSIFIALVRGMQYVKFPRNRSSGASDNKAVRVILMDEVVLKKFVPRATCHLSSHT